MKKIFLTLLMLMMGISFTSATTSYITKTQNNHAYKVIKVTLDGKSKIVVAVVDNYSPAQSLQTLMTNVGGSSAINGGFFCPDEPAYSGCVGNTTDNLRIANGMLYSKRGKDVADFDSVFGFDSQGIPMPMAQKEPRTRVDGMRQNNAVDAIFNGMMMPTIVKSGVNVTSLNIGMLADPKQSKAAQKSFICSTQDKSIVYMGVVENITFTGFGDYLITTFKCYNAIQLDNGGSRAMISSGKYILGPGRNIMDAFVVVEGTNVDATVSPGSTTTNVGFTLSNDELQKAITRMYNAGLTKYDTKQTFLPNNTMTREEASKFFGVFAKNEFQKIENTDTPCSFTDLLSADPTLSGNIQTACKLGIFKGADGKFMPKNTLTNAEAITVLMRVVVGSLPEPSWSFSFNYIMKAQEIGLIGTITPEANITRGAAAILLYKAAIYRETLE